MAGYLFTFSDIDSLISCIQSGIYSTRMKTSWSIATEGTLGDFISMKPGDNVYLFSKRIVYGIGEIIEIAPGLTVVENWPTSTSGEAFDYAVVDPDPVLSNQPNQAEEVIQRWIVAFRPSPYFFKTGIDMDDLLQSDPHAFRSLRVFWKRSFIKLDDEENLAFKAAILRKNLGQLNADEEIDCFECCYTQSLHEITEGNHKLSSPDIKSLLSNKRQPDGSLKSEMLLEIALLDNLSHKSEPESLFGQWDYLSHQVNASPMKAVDYMDKIDVFGYRWLPNYENQIIEKYFIAELKKGSATIEDVFQLMKYVDWVSNEYASGDYFRLKAFLVAKSFAFESLDQYDQAIERNQLTGRRPAKNEIWNDVTLVTYEVEADGEIVFSSFPVD